MQHLIQIASDAFFYKILASMIIQQKELPTFIGTDFLISTGSKFSVNKLNLSGIYYPDKSLDFKIKFSQSPSLILANSRLTHFAILISNQ